MPNFKDITGQTFGRLKVVSRASDSLQGRTRWLCNCSCGESTIVVGASLVRGASKSCGCLNRELAIKRSTSHGLRQSSEYGNWLAMRGRCLNPNNSSYERYGGRGISICSSWDDFAIFLKDMGNKPSPKHTIERKGNNGNYCKENCYWGTYKEQANNRSNNRYLTLNGVTKLLAIYAEEFRIHPRTLRSRLKDGQSVEEALLTPIKNKGLHI